MDRFTVGRALFVLMMILVVLMFVIPFIYAPGTLMNLDGSPGRIDHSWGFLDPVSAVVYWLGDLICHQECARSFILNGNQMAFCCRDTAIIIGLTIGLLITDKRFHFLDLFDTKVFIAGIVLVAIGLLAWAVEYAFSSDVVVARVVTGAMAGFGAALVIQYTVSRQYRKIMEG